MTEYGLTTEKVEEQIAEVDYNRFGEVGIQCVITLNNGFAVAGESPCPATFEEEIGKRTAYVKAFDKLWLIFGYQEKQRRFEEAQATWVDRLRDEYQQLDKKFIALTDFIYNPDGSRVIRPESVSEEQWELMFMQHTLMKSYRSVLSQRLKLVEPSI